MIFKNIFVSIVYYKVKEHKTIYEIKNDTNNFYT
jgi:hypothetical protein